MATIKADILNIIGQEVSSTYLEDDIDAYSLIEDAIWEAANVLPPALITASSGYLGDDPENLPSDADSETDYNPAGKLYEDGSDISANNLILFVERVVSKNTFQNDDNIDTESYETRFCKQISIIEKHKALDSGSIYFATDFTPVFWLEHYKDPASPEENDRRIYTAPKTDYVIREHLLLNWLDTDSSALKIYAYPRQTGITSSSDSIDNISTPAKSFVLKVCAIKILDQKLGNLATSEEDGELYQLVKAKLDELKGESAEHLKQLREVYDK